MNRRMFFGKLAMATIGVKLASPSFATGGPIGSTGPFILGAFASGRVPPSVLRAIRAEFQDDACGTTQDALDEYHRIASIDYEPSLHRLEHAIERLKARG